FVAFAVHHPGRKHAVRVEIQTHRDPILFQSVLALRVASRFAGLLDGGKQQLHEDGDDPDNHEEFDERKPAAVGGARTVWAAHNATLLRQRMTTGNDLPKTVPTPPP